MEYQEFIRSKVKLDSRMGFEATDIHPVLKLHQADIVKWAVEGGRRAIFASFGLGKTLIQLECLRQIQNREQGRQLVIAPLGVRAEFKHDVKMLDGEIEFIRRTDELGGDGLYITNYESVRDGKLDVNQFNAISLDEASVLRSYGSKTFQEFLTLFDQVKYRFVATATPSPNRFKELIHYAGFLGIMDTGQSLTRFFKRDSTKANNLTLLPSQEKYFWLWVSSWAAFIQSPSDLGHSDDGYDLPPLNVHYHKVESDTGETIDRKGQMLMFPDASLSLKDAAKEKRESMDDRVEQILEIVKDIDGQMVIWATQNGEQQAIERMLKSEGITYSSLYGHQDIDSREDLLNAWKDKETRAFVSKPTMYGAGVNMQQCNQMIFAGIDYKFYDMIQSIHRIYRFLQERPCHVHIIYTQTESEIMKTLNEKWDNHKRMVKKMTDIIKKYGLSHIKMEQALTRKIDIDRQEVSGEGWTAVNNDCVNEAQRMEENSVGLIHTSIPFANHYEYTPSYLDFGYTDNNDHFWSQMDYLTPELYRILQPGRIYACHVKDRILFGNVTGKGAPTVSPFHAECIFHGMKHGFDYMGLITVVTDVVRENNQTYRLGWTEQCKDGTKMGAGSPEYIVIFRKPQTDRTKGYADVPVEKSKDEYSRSRWQIDAHAFWRSSGERYLKPEEMATYPADVIYRVFREYNSQNLYDYDHHVKIGEVLDEKGSLPATFMSLAPVSHNPEVWTDINRMRTLNSEQARRNLTMHICPLQHDIVDRIITRFSNKDDLVFDPFGGLMTVPVRAIRLGRRGYASELNPDYWRDGLRYLRNEEQRQNNPTLFDFEKMEATA
jgi:hypothetical protein